MINKIYSFLGLAQKAGKLISGDETCERAVKLGRTGLVIVAEDASANTKKKFADICNYRDVEIRFYGEKELLGRYIGKEIRTVIAVLDGGFAAHLKEMIDGSSLEFGGGIIGKG